MRFLALDEEDGITTCNITSDVDSFIKFIDSIEDIKEVIKLIRQDAEFVLAMDELLEAGEITVEPAVDITKEVSLAKESLETAQILESRAIELGLL